MQIWKVELVPEAQNDFSSLDGSVRKRVLKQLVKLEQNPNYGDPLGNKAGINLDGYFKLYADKKQKTSLKDGLKREVDWYRKSQ